MRDYEPIPALDGGLDGLAFHHRILEHAAEHLETGGRIFLEIAFDQGDAALQVAREYKGYDDLRILKDYGGRDRVLTATKAS